MRRREPRALVDVAIVDVETGRLVPEQTVLIAGDGSAEAVGAIVEDSLGLLDPRRRYVSDALLAFWRVQATLDKYATPRDWPHGGSARRVAIGCAYIAATTARHAVAA